MDNNKLTLGVGLAQEIEHALNRNGFQSLEEVKALTVGDFLAQVRGVKLGLYEIKPIEHAIDLGADPFLPDGWKVEEHQKGKVAKLERKGDDLYLDGKKIEFWLSSEQKRGVITGNILRVKLKDKPALNANVLATVLLPVALVFLLMLANDRGLMGKWVNRRTTNLAALVVVVIVALSGAAYGVDSFLLTTHLIGH